MRYPLITMIVVSWSGGVIVAVDSWQRDQDYSIFVGLTPIAIINT